MTLRRGGEGEERILFLFFAEINAEVILGLVGDDEADRQGKG